MPRVLATADAVGGVWPYALELARALAVHGIDTTIATMGPRPSRDQLDAAADVPGLEIVVGDFRLEWMDDAWDDVERAGAWLLDLEARLAPDLVHLNGYAHAALPWRAPVVVAGHSCVLSWQDAVGDAIEQAWLARYRALVTAGLRAADWVVAPTAAMLASLQTLYGPLPRASVIPNGRSPDAYAPGTKTPLIFSAGRLWDRAKNADALASIARRLPWRVAIAGEGRSGDPFVGRQSEAQIRGWLARAALVALPARYEPFGLLALEAGLAGCALVLGDIPSLREVWGDAALFVDPENPGALHDAIAGLIASPPRLADLARRARARALAFSPSRMARRYLEVYRCASAPIRSLPCAS